MLWRVNYGSPEIDTKWHIIISADFSYTRNPERDRGGERESCVCDDVCWLHHVPTSLQNNRINAPSNIAYKLRRVIRANVIIACCNWTSCCI